VDLRLFAVQYARRRSTVGPRALMRPVITYYTTPRSEAAAAAGMASLASQYTRYSIASH